MTLLFDLPIQHTPDELDKYGAVMTSPAKRPQSSDIVVRRAAAMALMPKITQWLGKDYDPSQAEDFIGDLTGVLNSYDDGYTMAKNLEHKHWLCDSDLVEILDDGAHMVYRAHDRLVKVWVKTHKIPLALGLGTRVQTPDGPGEITEHHAENAKYTVFMPAKGHVRTGVGTHGHIVLAEDTLAA
jgi:hypothetical protein